MAKKDTPKTTPTDTRTPAADVLTKFIKDNDMVIILDEAKEVQKRGGDYLYTFNTIPRIQVYYKDQINKEVSTQPKAEN